MLHKHLFKKYFISSLLFLAGLLIGFFFLFYITSTFRIKNGGTQVAKDVPFAYLRTDYGYLALSKKGTVIMKERSTDIPHPAISFYQTIHHSEYQVGQGIGFTAIKRALIFVALLEDEGYQTETVAIDSVDMIACKTKGFEVVFSQSRPIELQSHEVRQIISQIKVGTLRIERLDLRFKKPVVQLPQK